MRVITFSRYFLKGHPRAGEPTFFVEKILQSQLDPSIIDKSLLPKYHTIRSGERWKVGDMASLRAWKGLPYRSKQLEICQVEIKKIWPVEISGEGLRKTVGIIHPMSRYQTLIPLADVAKNDGLSNEDFINWFPKNFVGQIICWNEKINY